MPLRPVTYADLVPAAKVLHRAFKDEHLFGQIIHPYTEQYPDDMYLHFLNKLRVAYVSGPDNHMVVTYAKNDKGQETITGLAHWRRVRAHPPNSFITNTKISAISWYNYLESFIYPNRAAEPSRTGILGASWPFIAHHWTGSRGELWDLCLLGVDPSAGRQGFGRELVKYGFELAKKEGVGCSVISADGKEVFYQTCGFDVIAGTCRDFGGDENPLGKVPGGTILFWDNGRDASEVRKYGDS